jgi:hypothetical protein
VWEALHRVLLARLGEADRIDWDRVSLDSASVSATRGDKEPARIRRIREKRARSAMLWQTNEASRSRESSAPQTSTTRRSWRKPWTPSLRYASLVRAESAQAPRQAACRQGLRFPSMAQGFEQEGHKSAHLPRWDRLQREARKAQVGGGAHDAGVARPLPQALDTLRATGGHQRSLPPSWLLARLPQLLAMMVLQGALIPCPVIRSPLSRRYRERRNAFGPCSCGRQRPLGGPEGGGGVAGDREPGLLPEARSV